MWQEYTELQDVSTSESEAPRRPASASGGSSSSKRPFSIDNADLVLSTATSDEEKSGPGLKENLVEDKDYILLPEQVWVALEKW